MMRLRLNPSHFPSSSISFTKPNSLLHHKRNLSFSAKTYSFSSIKMIQTIEHIVLLKVKENTDSSKIKPMVDGLKSLSSIETVQHLTAGPVYKNSSQSSFTFTHILHSRYKSKEDLQTYLAHPDHLGLVKETISPICDDMMFLDWVADVEEPIVHPSPGAAMRVSFLKVKDGEKEKCLKVVEETRDGSGSISQYTYGEIFL